MGNNRLKFGYEDTDKSIEIDLYGIVFSVNIRNKNIKELENIKDDVELEELKEIINKYLGTNAVDRINQKRKEDGYNEIDEDIATQIIMCIIKAYANTMLSGLTDMTDSIDDKINNTMENINKINNYRDKKTNYNRNPYRGNRRNYRRY